MHVIKTNNKLSLPLLSGHVILWHGKRQTMKYPLQSIDKERARENHRRLQRLLLQLQLLLKKIKEKK
jgi:hypothetical protein